MFVIEWNPARDSNGVATREFRIRRDGRRDITGALWLPHAPAAGKTLVCFGHGASGDRYQPPISQLAARFAKEAGLASLSIDGPVHGLRQVGEGGRKAFWPEFRRAGALEEMTEDWKLAVAAAQGLAEVGTGQLAYFGLSMGSIFGIPFIASRGDVTVATLRLFGVTADSPHHAAYIAAAQQIHCPVLYLMQLEDELFTREGYLRVFDTLASRDKRIHANPGLHPQVPASEIAFAFEFLRSHIEGTRSVQASGPLAE